MKSDCLILACSPRPGGNTDTVVRLIVDALDQQGMSSEVICLRQFKIVPCQGCQKCAEERLGHCVLAANDDGQMLLEKLLAYRRLFICSPIYFYHLPASLKALIDRSQCFYSMWVNDHIKIPMGLAKIILLAGRKKGANLFAGSLLTLKYFLSPFNYTLENLNLRGLDKANDLQAKRQIQEKIRLFAKRGAIDC
ncbi:flavodoxin family protein [Desulfovulcanus sp.]